MTKKLECIKNLKNKLTQMQRQLQKMEQVPFRSKQKQNQIEKLWMNKTVNLSNYETTNIPLTKSPSWKNPTFWGGNPISGKLMTHENVPKVLQERSPRSQKKFESQKIKQIKKFSTQNFYKETKPEESAAPATPKLKHERTGSQRYLYSFHGEQRETPRFQKIKTYDHPNSDPILNPQKPPQKGKKMVIQIPFSPTSNLVENPKSNPSLYFFNGMATAMSPKTHNRKNMSPNMKYLLSTSLEEKVGSPKRQSCKKHFTRYFKQTYEAKWN